MVDLDYFIFRLRFTFEAGSRWSSGWFRPWDHILLMLGIEHLESVGLIILFKGFYCSSNKWTWFLSPRFLFSL